MAFLNSEELHLIGFGAIGDNVLISEKASFYSPEKIWIGNNVRIDDYCVISAGEGGIEIGNNVHIAVFCSLIGAGRIKLGDFVGVSSRVSIYSSNDDYSGAALTGPMVPEKFRNVKVGDVEFKNHVIIGSGSVILPGVTLNEGVAIGALSMVSKDCEEFTIFSGVPVVPIKPRKRDIKDLEQEFLKFV